jgi:peptidoglycan hydrolase CwlO-like protein
MGNGESCCKNQQHELSEMQYKINVLKKALDTTNVDKVILKKENKILKRQLKQLKKNIKRIEKYHS